MLKLIALSLLVAGTMHLMDCVQDAGKTVMYVTMAKRG